jgi:hypothetical protein
MATYTHREIVSRRIEYIVPAAQPWGACLGDVMAGINAARVAYIDEHKADPMASLPDDALWFPSATTRSSSASPSRRPSDRAR